MSNYGQIPNEAQLIWAPIYEAVYKILGPTAGTIIPLGDTNHEAANRTTCTTTGVEQVVFTYNEAVTSFDKPPITIGPAHIPLITFNGTDEEADSPMPIIGVVLQEYSLSERG